MSTLETCERHFRLIESAVPPPRWVEWNNTYNWRCVEQLPTQMLLQKLARQLTALKCVDLLLSKGFLQEIGVTFRMLDEIAEDISFIVLGLSTKNWTSNHTKYAEYFWSEAEEDRHPPIQRKNIRAFINRVYDQPNPSAADKVGRDLHKLFSDFVHVRSHPIMGMVIGPPPRFELNGIMDSVAREPYVDQMPTYFYRGLVSTAFIAKVTLSEELHQECYQAVRDFEQQHGKLVLPL